MVEQATLVILLYGNPWSPLIVYTLPFKYMILMDARLPIKISYCNKLLGLFVFVIVDINDTGTNAIEVITSSIIPPEDVATSVTNPNVNDQNARYF